MPGRNVLTVTVVLSPFATDVTTKVPLKEDATVADLLSTVQRRLPHLGFEDAEKIASLDTVQEQGATLFPEDELSLVYEGGPLTISSSSVNQPDETAAVPDEKMEASEEEVGPAEDEEVVEKKQNLLLDEDGKLRQSVKGKLLSIFQDIADENSEALNREQMKSLLSKAILENLSQRYDWSSLKIDLTISSLIEEFGEKGADHLNFDALLRVYEVSAQKDLNMSVKELMKLGAIEVFPVRYQLLDRCRTCLPQETMVPTNISFEQFKTHIADVEKMDNFALPKILEAPQLPSPKCFCCDAKTSYIEPKLLYCPIASDNVESPCQCPKKHLTKEQLDEKECAICLNPCRSDESSGVDDFLVRGKCGHLFHAKCFAKYFWDSSKKCPVCKAQWEFENSDEETYAIIVWARGEENGESIPFEVQVTDETCGAELFLLLKQKGVYMPESHILTFTTSSLGKAKTIMPTTQSSLKTLKVGRGSVLAMCERRAHPFNMQVKIECGAQTVAFRITSNTTISDVLQRVSGELTLDRQYPILLHQGKLLNNHTLLCEISSKQILQLECSLEACHIDLDLFTNIAKLPSNHGAELLIDYVRPNEIVYVSQRLSAKHQKLVAQSHVEAKDLCTKELSWLPVPCPVSDKGMSQFLACMYKLTSLSTADAGKLTGHIRRLLVDWPPLSNALYLVAKKKFQQIGVEEKSVIANGLFQLIKLFMEKCEGKVEDPQLFEYVRVFLAVLVHNADPDDSKYEHFEEFYLTCEISQDPVEDPILHEGKLYSRQTFLEAHPDMRDEDLTDATEVRKLLRTYPNTRQILRWKAEACEFPEHERSILDMSMKGFKIAAKQAKAFPYISPMDLTRAQPPSITMVEDGVFAILVPNTLSGGLAQQARLLNPLTGVTVTKSIETLAMDVTESDTFVDDREILEGIYIVLDCSQSMSKHSGFTDRKGLKVGTWVKVHSLVRARNYNDCIGQIVNVMRNDRWPVKLWDSKKIITVRPANLNVERNCDFEKGWDASPLADLDTEAEKNDCLERFQNDPMLKSWLKAVEVYKSVCRNETIAVKMVLEEISAIFKMRDEDNDCAMSRMITKYQNEFAEVLKTANLNAIRRDEVNDEIGFLDENEQGNNTEEEDDIPFEFLCPITRDILEDPVVAEDGNTYERRAVERWFRQCHSSPMHGVRIGTRLVTNQNLKSQIQEWREAKSKQKEDEKIDKEEVEPSEAAEPEEIQIFVRCMSQRHTLHVKSTDTVADILGLMEARTGLEKKLLVFQYNGISVQKMREHHTLQHFGIKNEQHVNVNINYSESIQKRDPVCVEIQIRGRPYIGSNTLNFLIQEDETFEMIAWRIWCTAIRKARTDERCYRPSKLEFWKDLKDSGDNFQTGTLINLEQSIRRQFIGSGWDNEARKLSLELYKSSGDREKRDYMTRLEAVKQLFEAFINRSQGYHFANHIGLITFGDSVEVKCKISPAFERFRNALQNVYTNGDTKLFDAMDTAISELLKWKEKYPQAKMRMVVLSDGADTNSSVSAPALARKLQENDITCDAVCIGSESLERRLHCLAKCSGGYCFRPQTLVSALRLNELETVLSQCERPPKGEINRVQDDMSLNSFTSVKEDECSDDTIPARKEIDVVHQPVRALEDVLKNEPEITGRSGIARKKRILRELKRLHKHPHPNVDVFPCEEDLNFLQLLFEGPADTPYAGGVWLVDVVFPADFPDIAPSLRFRTPIKHCNINMYGRVCHSIFGRGWNADTSLKMVIECVFGLFLNPEFDDPLDSALAAEYYEASGTYEFSIKQHTAKHFKHTREEWKEILSKEASEDERLELALKRDLIRRCEEDYVQKPDDFCFGCREKVNALKRCACHLAVFCRKRFGHCQSLSTHECTRAR